MTKRKHHPVVITLLALLALLLILAGIFLLGGENRLLRDTAFVYRQNQSLALYENDSVTVSVLFVGDPGKTSAGGSSSPASMLLSGGDGTCPVIRADVKELKSASLFSPYTLSRITMQIDPDLKAGESVTYRTLQIGSESYDIGSVNLFAVASGNGPDIGIGTSPYYPDPGSFNLVISNREAFPVTFTRIWHMENGADAELLDTPVTVDGGAEAEMLLRTGFSNARHVICPAFEYTSGGTTWYGIPLVSTEYTESLSKEDILNEIRREGTSNE